MKNKMELLSPAGDMEKLKFAVNYGADAVYAGGKSFGLRAKAGNFDHDDLVKAVEYVHEKGKRIYITANIFARNDDFDAMALYFKEVENIGVDALIISDPGVLSLARGVVPDMEIHLSTQANTVNYRAVKFWGDMGVKRIILARELSLNEIRGIKDKCPDIELEAFVHGAMCVSWSGRCHISSYMTGRDANKGECAHPCRYKFALVEEKRPNEFYPIEEDDRGSYILNSKDMCMINHLKDLQEAGLDSLKIEGRMKSINYVAQVTSAYRREIDRLSDENYSPFTDSMERVSKASHRPFSTGFYYGKPDDDAKEFIKGGYIREYNFAGVVKSYENGCIVMEQRNKFSVGDVMEVLLPSGDELEIIIESMFDSNLNPIESAPHPQMKVFIKNPLKLPEYSILRRKIV